MTTLELQEVSYTYDGGRPVLDHVTARFEAGRLYAILGPSGSGKTTLLSLLGGLDSPTRGRVLLDGADIAGGLARHRREGVSFIFQSHNLLDYLTPLENAALTARLDPAPILARLGLTGEESARNVQKLSGGQRQRVAIARALAANTPVILADEPTGSLDPATAGEITALLKESARRLGKCVVMVTHDHAAARQADAMLELKGGQLRERP